MGNWNIQSPVHRKSRGADESEHTYGELKFSATTAKVESGDLRGWGSFSAGFLGIGASASGVLKNSGSATKYSVPAGTVGVFPQNGPVVVRWKAPKSGDIQIRARFSKPDEQRRISGRSRSWKNAAILHAVTTLQAAHAGTGQKKGPKIDHLVPIGWASGTKSIYQGDLAVAANDTIEFVIDPMYSYCDGHTEHPDGNGSDVIGLWATIKYESPTIAAKK